MSSNALPVGEVCNKEIAKEAFNLYKVPKCAIFEHEEDAKGHSIDSMNLKHGNFFYKEE